MECRLTECHIWVPGEQRECRRSKIKEIRAENFPALKTDMRAQIRSAYSVLNRASRSKVTPRYTVVKLQCIKDKEKTWKLQQRHPSLLGPHPEPGFMPRAWGSHTVNLVGMSQVQSLNLSGAWPRPPLQLLKPLLPSKGVRFLAFPPASAPTL